MRTAMRTRSMRTAMRTRSMDEPSPDSIMSGKEVFKTPSKDTSSIITNPIKSSGVLPRTDSEQSEGSPSTSKLFICSICRNSETLRATMLDATTQTLLDKLKRANDTFSDSMNKIERLSTNLNKFLITNGSSAQSQESHFEDIINRLSELSQKSEALGNSITINDTSIHTLQSIVAELKNLSNNQVKYPLSSSDDLKSILAEDIDSLFTINPFNERVLKDVKHVTTNPTSHINSYDENFLPSELRTLICEYLDSCQNFYRQNL